MASSYLQSTDSCRWSQTCTLRPEFTMSLLSPLGRRKFRDDCNCRLLQWKNLWFLLAPLLILEEFKYRRANCLFLIFWAHFLVLGGRSLKTLIHTLLVLGPLRRAGRFHCFTVFRRLRTLPPPWSFLKWNLPRTRSNRPRRHVCPCCPSRSVVPARHYHNIVVPSD